MQGIIFDFQRFSIHDGSGIRTTIFLKGCPLHCKWCHNPEGINPEFSLNFRSATCIHCGKCFDVCNCHYKSDTGKHMIDFDRCSTCGRCADICRVKALSLCGQLITPEEAVKVVLADKAFYSDGGGATFSGGEPLFQAEFVAETAKLIKANGVAVAIDTCGNVPWIAFEKVLPYCDLFLYDIKAASPDVHEKGTGVSNELILENLSKLDQCAKDIWVRVPVIPAFNDSEEEVNRICNIVSSLSNVRKVTLIPYHTLGKNKYEELGLVYGFDSSSSVTEEQMENFRNIFRARGIVTKK